MIVLLYLGAIATANLLAAAYGRTYPWVIVVNALVLIAFDLTARDTLHDRWHRRRLRLRMALLIAAGGLVSWLVNPSAGRVAVASTLAFTLASAADAAVYHWQRHRPWVSRANRSNIVGAAVDSAVFPLAAGFPAAWLPLGLFAAKVAGGAAWTWILAHARADDEIASQPAPLPTSESGPADRP
jgi:uncharacterized PurR-regulated membrane protein YhhQ (DUF165 family)